MTSILTIFAGVDWGLLGVGMAIVVVGGVCLALFMKGRPESAPPSRRPRPATRADTVPVAEMSGPVEYRQNYDRAFRAGDFGLAARIAQTIHDNRLFAEAMEQLGEIDRAVGAWVELGEYDRAARLLDKINQPTKAAQMYLQAGRHQKAAARFVQGNDLSRAATVYREMGDVSRANELEALSLAKRGKHIEAAKLYVANSDMLRAAEQLVKGQDIPKAVEAYRRAGKPEKGAELLLADGQIEAAAPLFEEASFWQQAAKCYGRLERQNDYERCLQKAGRGYNAGRMAFDRGDLEQALALFESVPTLDDNYYDAGLFRGQIYERLGQPQEAAGAYIVFLEQRSPDVNNTVLYNRVARILEGIGRPRTALKILSRLITSGLGTPETTDWASRLAQASEAEPGEESDLFGETLSHDSEPSAMNYTARIQALADSTNPIEHLLVPSADRAIDALGDRYRFGESMGQGGNGIVYRAMDMALDREVVVKFLHQALLPTEVARNYFVREAKTAGKLNHPNIVTIFDIGEAGSALYYSMELVEGKTLAEIIVDAGGQLTHSEALPMVQGLCNALQYAHNMLVIHRDIKPGNVMVNQTGEVKLLDFGLAKALDENPDKSVFLCGTPFYMSPEQIRREFLDHRTDIYSLGCLLYAMYTGNVPFPDGNVFQHHQNSPPPDPRERVPDMPAPVAEVLLRTVEKDRKDRFNRVEEVAFALSQVT